MNKAAKYIIAFLNGRIRTSLINPEGVLKIILFQILILLMANSCGVDRDQADKVRVSVDWGNKVNISGSYATLQVIPNPSHQQGSHLREPLWNSLRGLKAHYVRYSPWGIYPELKIAELKPPTPVRTYWDFSSLDPLFDYFMSAMEGRPVVMNYQAIPGWMFLDPRPEKPGKEIGSLFRDNSGMELAEYFARIVAWYTKGGFRDENGKWHESGHRYDLGIWEILNEPDHESIAMTKELYTSLYDAVVGEILKVQPQMKFMGLSMANMNLAQEWTSYFLDGNNHKPDVPVDYISYHMYATLPGKNDSPELYPMNVFNQADNHLKTIGIVDSIRQKLSPDTRIDINESGILFREPPAGWGRMEGNSIDHSFWNLSAAYYAYIYAGLARMGVNIIGKSTLWSDPNDWPEVSLLNWNNGKPNARYHVLKLITENFGPGDVIVETVTDHSGDESQLLAQGFITSGGTRKILLVNKSKNTLKVRIPGCKAGTVSYVDQTTGFEPPASMEISGSDMIIRSFGVALLTLKR